MEIYERIRKVRESLGYSRESFGATIGVSKDVVANIELNRLSRPEQKEPIIKLICKVYNVNEHWLRHGGLDEDMFVLQTVSDRFNSFPAVGRQQFKDSVLRAADEMSDEWWDLFYQKFLELAKPPEKE